jgi:hypothetical protein
MAETNKKTQVWLTPKQRQFIDFINKTFRFGELKLVIHNSDPQVAKDFRAEQPFDGAVEKSGKDA